MIIYSSPMLFSRYHKAPLPGKNLPSKAIRNYDGITCVIDCLIIEDVHCCQCHSSMSSQPVPLMMLDIEGEGEGEGVSE